MVHLPAAHEPDHAHKKDVTAKPKDAFAPPSRDVSLCALPGAQLFDSQVRFTANNTVIEQTNYYSDMAHAQLLTTTTNDAASTSGSNMLMTLRKDRGTHADILPGSRAISSDVADSDRSPLLPSDDFVKVPLSAATSATTTQTNDMDGPSVTIQRNMGIGQALGRINERHDTEDTAKTEQLDRFAVLANMTA